uniref:Taste receptor type 2 n=1 Tax=Leptobrachium leishanense TaxID=445787 RepID=A0A8C5R866_9ANUR
LPSIFKIILMLIYSVVSLGGIISNIFIFALNVKDCRRKRLSSCDILVSSIAFSNILFQCLAAVFCSAMTVTSYFLWLKVTLPKNVPWLGCGAAVVSLVTSLTAIFDHSFSMKKIPAPGNTTMLVYINTKPKCNCFYAIYLLSTSLAFALCFTSVISILVSLYKHVRRMKRSSENNSNQHTVALFGAAKTVTLLLLLYILFYTTHFLTLFHIASPGLKGFWPCSLVLCNFPVLNAVILIQGNVHLKKAFTEILKNAVRCSGLKTYFDS